MAAHSNRQEITRKKNVLQGGETVIDQTIENAPERVTRTHAQTFFSSVSWWPSVLFAMASLCKENL